MTPCQARPKKPWCTSTVAVLPTTARSNTLDVTLKCSRLPTDRQEETVRSASVFLAERFCGRRSSSLHSEEICRVPVQKKQGCEQQESDTGREIECSPKSEILAGPL